MTFPRVRASVASGLIALLVAFALPSPRSARAAPAAAKKAAKSNVVLSLSVSGAEVSIDRTVAASNAPQVVELSLVAGPHTLRVVREGFEPFEQEIKAPPPGAEPLRVDVLLRIAPPPAAAPPPAEAPKEAVPARARAKGPPAIRLALYDFEAKPGIAPALAVLLTEAALGEVRKLDRISTIGMAEVREMLSFETSRQLLGCDASECLAELGGALGVDELVTGSLGAVGDTRLLTVRRLDMKRATMKAAATRRLKAGDGEEFFAALGDVFAELFPEYPLREGRKRGVSDAIVSRLHPPPLKPWVAYTTGAAAAAGLVAAGVFGVLVADAQADFDRVNATLKIPPGTRFADFEASAERLSNRATYLNVALGAGLALAGLCAIEAGFLTDWNAPSPPGVAGSGGDGLELHLGPAGLSGRF